MNVSREVAKNREADVDQDIRAAAVDEEDAEGRYCKSISIDMRMRIVKRRAYGRS